MCVDNSHLLAVEVEPGRVDWEYWQNDWPDHLIACTRANAADAFPRALTPLTRDLVVRFEDDGCRRLYEDELRAVTPEKVPDHYVYAPYGLVYFNADQLAALGDGIPGTSRQSFYEQFFGLERSDDAPESEPGRDGGGIRQELGNARRVIPRLLRLKRTLPQRLERQAELVRSSRPARPETLDRAELSAWLHRLDELQTECWLLLIGAATLAGAHFDTVSKLLAKWAGDERGDLANRLHVDLGGNESAEAGRAIAALAELARVDRDSADFTRQLAAFFERFGHRGPGELELENPNWRTDQRQVLDLIDVHLSGQVPSAAAGSQTRRRAEAELHERLAPYQRRLLAAVLRQSRRQLPLRETSKVPLTLLWDELRRLLERAGTLLHTAGELPDPARIVYLGHGELHALLEGGTGPSAVEIERRVEQRERCLSLELPELVQIGPGFVRPLPREYMIERGLIPPEEVAADARDLTGLGVASGYVTAPATVLTDALDPFPPGNVLVASTVDPGWSAVLAMASAIVLDVGGPMSHGAVVAREFGIPCVVNVKAGTRLIADNDEVTVDGSRGIVRIGEGG
jgi:phosphohistidine swiveling domain-containing protein